VGKPWDGKQFWIWELDQCSGGDVGAIVAAAKSAGLSGLIVKAWDGSNYWSQIERIVGPARKAGLAVGAWGYSYGQNIQGEAGAMQRAVAAGPDWLVIDAEIEYESATGRAAATALFDALEAASLSNCLLAYTTFALPEYHPQFPYDLFSRHCQVALPQVYWGDMGMAPDAALKRCLSAHAGYGLPVAPVGQSYGAVTQAEILTFGNIAESSRVPGISFWSWQHATGAMCEAIKTIPLGDRDSHVSDWARAAWEKAVNRGVFDGTQPQGTVTREMLAVVLDSLKLL